VQVGSPPDSDIQALLPNEGKASMTFKRLIQVGAGLAAIAVLAACGSSSGGAAPSGSPSGSQSPFGAPDPATGTPITVGVISLELGPVTFPMYRQGLQAAIDYINEYKGGIGGHPLKLVHCETDGQPATSARCANQILDSKPTFVFGGADTGAPGSVPVYARANLAMVGGLNFTPVESNYKNGVIFSAISGADNAATTTYASQQGAKSASIIYTSDTQGTRAGQLIVGYAHALGMQPVSSVPVPPTAADVSTQAATVVTSKPDFVFVNTPVGCASMLKNLNELGYTGLVGVIDPCTDPRTIAAAGAGANGMFWGSPVELPNTSADSTLFAQIAAKWAPTAPLTSITAIAMQSVINAQAKLSPIANNLTTSTIMQAFQSGTNNPNFMGHPYTCDGKQLPGSTSVCNAYQRIFTYKDGKSQQLADWIDPTKVMTAG
jgi:branched-chain amino acid transport system substrate-binding protein